MPIPPIAPYPMPRADQLPTSLVDWCPHPERAVLLVHDMQAYFTAAFAADCSPYVELLANLGRLRRTAAELGIPVVYSAQPGAMDRRQRGLLHDFWGEGMRRRPDDVDIVDALRPGQNDLVITKWRYSAFVRSGLEEAIRAHGRDQLIVCGIYAHIGCLVTAIDAFSLDIEPFLVADAVADMSADHHRLALEYAARCCSRVLSTKQVVNYLKDV